MVNVGRYTSPMDPMGNGRVFFVRGSGGDFSVEKKITFRAPRLNRGNFSQRIFQALTCKKVGSVAHNHPIGSNIPLIYQV